MIPRAIIYPLMAGGSHHADFELRHSLRSLEMYFEAGIPVYVLSSMRPKWLSSEVHYLDCVGYLGAMRLACDLAKEIVWMNDDIYFLQPTTWDDLRTWKRSRSPITELAEIDSLKAGGKWSASFAGVIEELRARGLQTYNYSNHIPYLYDTTKLRETIAIFGGWNKTPIETAYANYWKVPAIEDAEVLPWYQVAISNLGREGKRYFNHNDKALLNPRTKPFITGIFPNPSRYEIPS